MGTDLSTSLEVSDNTADGGRASMVVQTPAVLDIVSLTPNQPAVTVSQDSLWLVDMLVENTGGSEVALHTSVDSTDILFNLGAGWAHDNAPLYADGPVLAGNTNKIVTFNMVKAGDQFGTAQIDGFIRGTQSNDGAAKQDSTDTSGSGSIEVQQPAAIVVASVRSLQDSVTMSQTNNWFVEVVVRNDGGASALLDLAGGVTALDFPAADTISGYVVNVPTGNDTVTGGQADTLTFEVETTPTFAAPGRQEMVATIHGIDLTTRADVDAFGSDSVTVESEPVPTYVASSISHTSVSPGYERHVLRRG